VKKTGESASADSVAGPENAEHFKMIRALVTTTNLSSWWDRPEILA